MTYNNLARLEKNRRKNPKRWNQLVSKKIKMIKLDMSRFNQDSTKKYDSRLISLNSHSSKNNHRVMATGIYHWLQTATPNIVIVLNALSMCQTCFYTQYTHTFDISCNELISLYQQLITLNDFIWFFITDIFLYGITYDASDRWLWLRFFTSLFFSFWNFPLFLSSYNSK